MMPRYRAEPRSAAIYDDSADATSHTADEIILPADGDEWINSGLLDQRGLRLYRRRDREPIGF